EHPGGVWSRTIAMEGLLPDASNPSEWLDQLGEEEPDPQETEETWPAKGLVVWSTHALWAWWQGDPGASPSLAAGLVSEWEFQPGAAFHGGQEIEVSGLPLQLLQVPAKPDQADTDSYVTLDQAAAMVNRSKRTLENYKRKGLP